MRAPSPKAPPTFASSGMDADKATRQRERILDAAEKIFLRHGFHGTSMRSIAVAARMSIGLMYHYFGTKRAIVMAVVARCLEHDRWSLRYPQAGSGELVGAVLEALKHWRQRGDSIRSTIFLELMAESSRDGEIGRLMRDRDRRCDARVERALLLGAQSMRRTLTRHVARDRAVVLQCFIEGLALRAARNSKLPGASAKSLLERFVRMLGA
jgi:AcrR family transcriptional regulator